MTSFETLLRVLVEGGVEFVVVGGIAARIHGAARVTQDVDVVYSRSAENIERLAAALAPLDPYLRGAPRGLPFRFDAPTIRAGLNFTLATSAGDIDVLGEIVGGGSYASLASQSTAVDAFGLRFKCLNLPALIASKRAAGRVKDFDAIAELEALAEERRKAPEG